MSGVDNMGLQPGERIVSTIDDIEFKIARLDLQPGDILVVKCRDSITCDMENRIRDHIKQVAPCHKGLILEGGMDLAVLTASEIDRRSFASYVVEHKDGTVSYLTNVSMVDGTVRTAQW